MSEREREGDKRVLGKGRLIEVGGWDRGDEMRGARGAGKKSV